MRESNFAFPAQNRAGVVISSQLYDRRALDTNSPLPLFNSLTHLTYLTSTSPRIREIMTFDGGLERLVAILRDFCLSPPPPENPALLYGLAPPGTRPPRRPPLLNPSSYDKHAAYRFSLAFQSVVNIGVRGSEDIRARVVQAGTLDVVGCVLEAWLASKGFAVGPSSSASGLPRETREQRNARRAAQAELRSRQQAAELERALRRQIELDRIRAAQAPVRPPQASPTSETPTDTDRSTNATPGASTPTGAVTVPGRERSGTIIGRPVWDGQGTVRARRTAQPEQERAADDTSGDTSRAETETEDDADVDMNSGASSPNPRARRAVGIVSDNSETAEPSMSPNTAGPLTVSDAHIIVDPTVLAGEGVGVEDGLVSLEQNDDFALGAPPGAPGAIDGTTPRTGNTRNGRLAPDITPRALPVALPGGAGPATIADRVQPPTIRPPPLRALPPALTGGATITAAARELPTDAGPYRDEDVLLGLQLLAYLSKYPHVRQAFYKPRTTFHPATAAAQAARQGVLATVVAGPSTAVVQPPAREASGFFKAFGGTRGKEKAKATTTVSVSTASNGTTAAQATSPTPLRQTNVFSLVERFTFRPSSSEAELPNAPPMLPPEIQYWAGVIMRNACRKDDSRGGIRQCANMLCGKWESFPREFAKCRRCRKAKYCGKECQSTAWSEGHRFWCSAKDTDGDEVAAASGSRAAATGIQAAAAALGEAAEALAQMDPDMRVVTATQLLDAREQRRRERATAAAGEAVTAAPIPRGAIPAVEAARAIHTLFRLGQAPAATPDVPVNADEEPEGDENVPPPRTAGAAADNAWPWAGGTLRRAMRGLTGRAPAALPEFGDAGAATLTQREDNVFDPLAFEHPAEMFVGGVDLGGMDDGAVGVPVPIGGNDTGDGVIPVVGGTGTIRARRRDAAEDSMILD